MKSECFPFTKIPHSTKLFTDFLAYAPGVRPFYPRSPFFSEWLGQETPDKRYDAQRREGMSAIFERQAQSFGASEQSFDNIRRFRAGACAAVTGQQVGLLGGPLFSLFKALSAVKLAEEATQARVDCVPVFWLATEDHDIEEVSRTAVLGSDYQLETLSTSSTGIANASVGAVPFGSEIEATVEKAAALLGNTEILEQVRQSYRAGETFGSAFAKLFAKIFADWGVIILDAGDPAVDRIAEPMYRAAIERASELNGVLLHRGEELEAAGYHQQVKVTPSSTLLFAFRDGARIPIHRAADTKTAGGDFTIGEARISAEELLGQIRQGPDKFSANVLLRPVVQDFVLPTLAYAGGSAEVAYFAQVGAVYQKLLGHVTPVVPRFSATLVEAKPQRVLEKYGIPASEAFSGPDAVNQALAARALPQDVKSAFTKAKSALEFSLEEIRESLVKLDVTLVDAAKNTSEKMHHQLEQLRLRAARAEMRQTEVLSRHAQVLNNSLYPNKVLQEREIAGIYFLAEHGPALLKSVYEMIRPECVDHQVIQL